MLLDLFTPMASQLTTDLAECISSRWALAVSNFGQRLDTIFKWGDHFDARQCTELAHQHLSNGTWTSADPKGPVVVQDTPPNGAAVLCPIRLHGKTIAVLAFGSKKTGEAYTASDTDLIRHFAAHLSFLMSDERLATRFGKHAHLHRTELELESARLVQERFLPARLPRVRGLDFYGECWPSSYVGGDFFDFIAADDSALLVTIGDVSGKGVPAAIVMAGVQASLRVLGLSNGGDLRGLIRSLNSTIWQLAPENFFATMFCARIDAVRREMVYVNAGHDRAVLLRNGRRRAVTLEGTGTVLGLSTRSEFRQVTVPFEPGDILVAVTDGVTDIADEHDRQFEQILLEVTQDYANLPSSELAAHLIEATEALATKDVPADDRTVVVVRFLQAQSHLTIHRRIGEVAVMTAA